MHETHCFDDVEEWVIWNGSHGLVTTVTLGRVENGACGRTAWLDAPFDMVGPFNLDELEAQGRITFAACTVMSRRRWKEDQAKLRRESTEKRRAAQERMSEEFARFFGSRGANRGKRKPFNEREHRETLDLPLDGKLEVSQIKTAYRRLAQKVHPDVGGSHEEFILITEARDALLACIS